MTEKRQMALSKGQNVPKLLRKDMMMKRHHLWISEAH